MILIYDINDLQVLLLKMIFHSEKIKMQEIFFLMHKNFFFFLAVVIQI